MVELVGLICVEVIKLQPSVLLLNEQLTAYRDRLIALTNDSRPIQLELKPEKFPTLEWLEQLLAFALDHKLGIEPSAILPSSKMISSLIMDCWEHGVTYFEAAEELMDALLPAGHTDLEIHFAPGYLRKFSDSNDSEEVNCFYALRQAIYDEFGPSLPSFKFVENQTLRPRSFALKINAHLLIPWVGPGSASGASAPHSSQHEYVVRVLYLDLSTYLSCLFPRWYADYYVCGLDGVFSTLVRIVKDRFNRTQRVRVLRALLEDHVSLRNLQYTLERMLDYEGDLEDSEQLVVFVRAGIPEQFVCAHAGLF